MLWFNKTLSGRLVFGGMAFALGLSFAFGSENHRPIKVGSKNFPESYVLAEIMAQVLEASGFPVERRFGVGGTAITYEAIRAGAIDLYPEYSGTVAQNLLKTSAQLDRDGINRGLESMGLVMLEELGFNNTYALAVPRQVGEKLGLSSISDLRRHGHLRAALSYEFIERPDGWRALAEAYQLPLKFRGMEHNLSYEALASGAAEVMDVYSTDAHLLKFDLLVLADDRRFFPGYLAAPLVRQDLPKDAQTALNRLAGTLSEKDMIRLNAKAVIDEKPFSEIARGFLNEKGILLAPTATKPTRPLQEIMVLTGQHLVLTFLPIFLAILVAVPLGLSLLRWPKLANPIMTLAGLLQTIPSLALLMFMIWYFGSIGFVPAVSALFLYSLLPILRNTYAGVTNIDPLLINVAKGLGLYPREILLNVQLPLAMPIIVSGIRTAAVINVGTATIGAFIGAGGLGEPIVKGLALNDIGLILQGAIPAALLAILLEVSFNWLETHWLRRPEG